MFDRFKSLFIFCLLCFYSLLSGCATYITDTTVGTQVTEWGKIKRTEVYGPFTILFIHHKRPGSFLTSEDNFFYQVVYKTKVVVKEAFAVKKEERDGMPMLRLTGYVDMQTLLYEKDGKPILEKVSKASNNTPFPPHEIEGSSNIPTLPTTR
jgi:hypothetical protein